MSNRLILASASIGRKMLFEAMIQDFTIVVSNVDEKQFSHEDPRELPRHLAQAKAEAVAQSYPDDWVMAFDTLVLCENRLIGKPSSKEEAKTMLRFLSGKRQSVISGYAFVHAHKNIHESGKEETILHFAELTDDFIENYVNTHPVTRFAGGYAIQNDDQFITIEKGSFDVIVGAPMKKVREFLLRYDLEFLLKDESERESAWFLREA